ncbi:HSP20-like chaperone [Phyllosticta citrichinensis]
MFPRAFTQEISPLFRLLDDYDRASRSAFRDVPQSIRTFAPKFDVKETKEAYELHGELPGIAQKDINIEWSDGNTLTVSGRTEHRAERGERPQGFIEDGDASEQQKKDYHKPTVEEESAQASKGKQSTSTEVTTTDKNQEIGKPSDEAKYWVTERSVGEFHRSFSFPGRVDQDNVKASLKDGVLAITVPKAKAPQARKIAIQ